MTEVQHLKSKVLLFINNVRKASALGKHRIQRRSLLSFSGNSYEKQGKHELFSEMETYQFHGSVLCKMWGLQEGGGEGETPKQPLCYRLFHSTILSTS